jgi:NitT/TauT family transport system substrate-binding protein
MVNRQRVSLFLSLIFFLFGLQFSSVSLAQSTKLVVAYASPSASFAPAWVAKLEGLFLKYKLEVELILMQGASTYMPALTSGNIQVLYGGGTAVSRAIATGGFPLAVIASETRYVPLRLMVLPEIRTVADLKGKRIGVGRAGLDEYAALLYLQAVGLVPGKDVQIVYTAGGVPQRAAAMKQGLIDGTPVNPPNEYDLEKAGFHQLANFFDLKMPYAGVPHTVTRDFKNKNPRLVEDYITAVVEGMHLFRTNRDVAYKSIIQLTRQRDPALLERTYESYRKQYDSIGGLPYPWEDGMEKMISGFHQRFNPQIVKNTDAKPFIDESFVKRAAERLGLKKDGM